MRVIVLMAKKFPHRFWHVFMEYERSNFLKKLFIGLSHIRVSTHVSTAYRDTKGTSHVRRRYVGIRSSYSSIRSSYSSYAEVLRFFMCALKNS